MESAIGVAQGMLVRRHGMGVDRSEGYGLSSFKKA